MVRSGADLVAKNAAGKTPKEEVEIVTTLKADSELDPDYHKTLAYLSDKEEKAASAQPKTGKLLQLCAFGFCVQLLKHYFILFN